MKKRSILFWFLIFAFFLAQCAPAVQSTPAPTSPSANTLPPAFSSTATREVISTLTPLPTLSPQEAALRVSLWQQDENCRLSCWWGIIPGESTWDEAETILGYIGLSASSDEQETGMILHEVIGLQGLPHPAGISERISIYTKATGLVESMEVTSHSANEEEFEEYWDRFSPASILSIYGEPDQVMVEVITGNDGSPGATTVYNFYMIYMDQGFLVEYTGITEYGVESRICPSFGDTGNLVSENLRILLQSANSHYPIINRTIDSSLSVNPLPMEDVSNTSIDNFYQAVISGEDAFCFSTSKDFWKREQ